MRSKIKVALVCAFSNGKVREHLPLDNRTFYNKIRRLFRLPVSPVAYGDLAGWDTYMIEVLRKRDDIDLYVISSHVGLKRSLVSFDLDGVHYSFIKSDIATFLKHIIKSPALWHRLNPMRPIVRRIINKAKPDLIALVGAENPHISGTVLGISGIPLIVKCQTIYDNPERKKTEFFDKKNAYVERLIFDNLKYVSVNTKLHEKLFRRVNDKAYNFKWSLGNLLPEVREEIKVYDFVVFAVSMSESKGYPDAIRALGIVKKSHPDVKLNLVGKVSNEYKNELLSIIDSLGLAENVTFTPFFEKQEDLFQHIQKSSFALLPCKLDYISSTIKQAMYYELPVVCYKTEGTLTLNRKDDCVLIAEHGNVEDLAAKMLLLLEKKDVAEVLIHNAKEYSARWNEDKRISNQMMSVFEAIINNYRFDLPVPSELLYEPTNKGA